MSSDSTPFQPIILIPMQRRQILQLATLLGTAGSGLAFAQSDPVILVGQSAPFSGPAEQLGLQYNVGAQLAFEAVNAKGGVNGRRIELIRMDDGNDPTRCATNTRKLLADGVVALFGYVGTPACLAAMELAAPARTPMFAPLSGAPELRAADMRLAWHVRATLAEEAAAVVRHLGVTGAQRIAVIHQNDADGKAGLDGVIRAMRQTDLQPTAVASIERHSTDVGTALAQVLAMPADAIVLACTYRTGATLVRTARQKGFAGAFCFFSFAGTQALLDELGAMAKGVAVSQVVPHPLSPTVAIAADYVQAVRSRPGLVPNHTGMEGFVAARTLAEVLRRAGRSPSREGVGAAMDSLQKLDLGGFTVDFAPGRRNGSSYVDMTLLTADGRVKR